MDQVPQAGVRADNFLASWLMVENDNEIALAQYAVGKAKSDEVKRFAEMMIADHKKISDKFQPFAGTGAYPTDAFRKDDMGKRPEDSSGKRPDATGQRPEDAAGQRKDTSIAGGAGGPEALNHVELVRELGHKCLANAKRELDQKQGAEFDRCYMGMQIAAHAMVLTMLEVFPSHASDRLRATLEEGKATVQSHFDHAKQIVKTLETSAPSAGDALERKK